jgi:hypothetical protein
MDRCPNCDATVRPNAKFCTSCGFRLPNPAPVLKPEPEVRPDGWRSPFATTSASYEHNQSWTAPIPAPAPVPAPMLVPKPEPVVPPAPVEVAPVEAAAPADDPTPVFAGWPNFSTSSIPAEDDATVPPAVEDSAAHLEAADEEAPAETVETAPLEANASAEPEVPAAEPPVEPIPAEPVAAQPSSPEAEPGPTPLPEAGENPADNPTEPIPVMAQIAKSDIVQRALGLVDELRSLIPNLRSATGSDHGDAAAILTQAGAGNSDSGDLSALRAAIETAANRPRDIDVMMDLISRAGAIQDLLAERDRYADAITRALAAMGDTPD